MELNTFDRLILLNILPKEGDFTTLRIIRKLRDDLSFSEEEHKSLQFKIENNNVGWIAEADKPKDVPIGEKATDIIKSTLKKLDQDKKLSNDMLGVYIKFMGDAD